MLQSCRNESFEHFFVNIVFIVFHAIQSAKCTLNVHTLTQHTKIGRCTNPNANSQKMLQQISQIGSTQKMRIYKKKIIEHSLTKRSRETEDV